MSSTNRGSKRSDKDQYQTPEWAVEAIMKEISFARCLNILDAGAGFGVISKVFVEQHHHMVNTIDAIEIDEKYRNSLLDLTMFDRTRFTNIIIDDFLEYDFGELHNPTNNGFLNWPYYYDVVISNPPFTLAVEFILKSMGIAPLLIFLLPLSFVSSKKRREFLDRHPPEINVLSKRPSFTGKGTDSVDYGWFIWRAPVLHYNRSNPGFIRPIGDK